jgi:glutamyl-tRNA synthetase
VNFLALMAYPPVTEPDGSDREVFTFAEFSYGFDWHKVNPVGPVFDLKKLEWLNGVYIRALPTDELASRLLPYLAEAEVLSGTPSLGELGRLQALAPLVQTRIEVLSDAVALISPFFVGDDQLEIDSDARAGLGQDAARVLDASLKALGDIDDHATGVLGKDSGWTAAAVEAALRHALIDQMGLKPRTAFGPVRVAVSGARISPPLFESIEILGKTSTLARLSALRDSL